MTAQEIILAVTGLYLSGFAMVISTRNAKSALVFKVIPFFLGLACLYGAFVIK